MKKLIRDKIPEIMEANGKHCNCYKASDKEYRERLYDKLIEEVDELTKALKSENKDAILYELADVYTVLKYIIRENGISTKEFLTAFHIKLEERGGFDKKLIGKFRR